MIHPEDIDELAMGYSEDGVPVLVIRLKPEPQWIWVGVEGDF